MKNIDLAKRLILNLLAQGVRDFIVCAGARNAPLVKVLGGLAHLPEVQVAHFFEERSAAFFALGRARRDRRPACVVTTSGTAAAELLPAAVEAYYSCVPLVLVTADRPATYRGTGAPQTIDQVNIFGGHTGPSFCWDEFQQPEFEVRASGPTHLNISFDEPLIDGDDTLTDVKLTTPLKRPSLPIKIATENIVAFKRPLVIVSELQDPVDLSSIHAPAYFEGSSQMRSVSSTLGLRAFDRSYSVDYFKANFDSIVRIGGVPTHRIWRDLDLQLREVPVLSLSDRPFSGLGRGGYVLPLESMKGMPALQHPETDRILQDDKSTATKTNALMDSFPMSEAALVRKVSQGISENSLVFLSSSLPIREWDAFAIEDKKNFEVAVMRGVNGIDGVISHFLGRAKTEKENWLLVGDLTALYDIAAFAMKDFMKVGPLRVVIMNNGGGKIFAPMFSDSNFENRHSLNFKGIASTFGWDYFTDLQSAGITGSKFAIIEITPEESQTTEFLKAYKE